MEKLLHCPFCGSPKIRKSDAQTKPHFTYCDGCGAVCYWHSEDRWNTRATDQLMDEIVKALERYVDEYEQWEYAVECVVGRCPNTGVHLDQAREALQKYREQRGDQ